MRVEYTQRIRNGEVKSRRLALGLSQKQLGNAIGYSVAAICHVESFRSKWVSEGLLNALSRFFGVPVDTLYPSWLFEVAQVPVEVTAHLEVDQEAFERLSQAAADRISGSVQPALELAIAHEEVALLLAAFNALPPKQATALRLFCEGYSYREIARKMGRQSGAGILKSVGLATQEILRKVPDLKEYSQERIASLLRFGLGRDEQVQMKQGPRKRSGHLMVERDTKAPRMVLTEYVFRALQDAGQPIGREELMDRVLALGYISMRGTERNRVIDTVSCAAGRDPRVKIVRSGMRSTYSLLEAENGGNDHGQGG